MVAVNRLENISALNEGRPSVSYANNVGVIHPNGIWTAVGSVTLLRADRSKNLTGTMTWYCENMMTRSANLDVAPETVR